MTAAPQSTLLAAVKALELCKPLPGHEEAWSAAINGLYAALEARESAGWKLVPTEPDQALLRPFWQCPPEELRLAWQAMLMVAAAKQRRAASPVAAPVEARPVAYAVFAKNGNIRIWSTNHDLHEWAADEGLSVTPLYASPVAADTQGDAQDDREEALGNSIRALVAGYARCSDDLPPEQRPVSMAARSAFAIVHAIFYAPQSLTPETRARLAATYAAMKEQPSDGAAATEPARIDESKLPPRPAGHNGPDTDPDSPLVRYGRAKPGSGVLLERMADGYWTPWHIANELLRSVKAPGGCVAGECGKEEKRGL
jgi:hypothetical protein